MQNSVVVANGDGVLEAKDEEVGGNSGGGIEIKSARAQQRRTNGAIVRNKRVYFDVETKMHTLSRIENGEAKSAIIREMRLPPSTLATWIKDRDRIADLYKHSLGNRKRLRRADKSPTPTTIDVDPSTSAHLGGPFVTPSASDETTIGGADDQASNVDDEVTPPGEDGEEADSTETEAEYGAVEKDDSEPQLQPVQNSLQPSLHTVTTTAAATT
uniref:HTH psq-type domain-containing protein n=1 Tax=Macrostomum lignano TaxID=282301 RepID=A0A1I8I440_9PLAT